LSHPFYNRRKTLSQTNFSVFWEEPPYIQMSPPHQNIARDVNKNVINAQVYIVAFTCHNKKGFSEKRENLKKKYLD